MKPDMQFWLVWNQGGRAPKVKHETFQSAKAEAERLAANNPGQEFVVLQSVGSARTKSVEWESHNNGWVASDESVTIRL